MVKLETANETPVLYHITTWRQNPEDLDLNLHHRENLKSRTSDYGERWRMSLSTACVCVLDFI